MTFFTNTVFRMILIREILITLSKKETAFAIRGCSQRMVNAVFRGF